MRLPSVLVLSLMLICATTYPSPVCLFIATQFNPAHLTPLLSLLIVIIYTLRYRKFDVPLSCYLSNQTKHVVINMLLLRHGIEYC